MGQKLVERIWARLWKLWSTFQVSPQGLPRFWGSPLLLLCGFSVLGLLMPDVINALKIRVLLMKTRVLQT